MRRALTAVTAVLLLVGLQLATRTPGLAFERLRSGTSALLDGEGVPVGMPSFVAGLVLLCLSAALGAFLVWSRHLTGLVRTDGSACPECGRQTRRVPRKEWQRLLSRVAGHELKRRRCGTCGWSGLAPHHAAQG